MRSDEEVRDKLREVEAKIDEREGHDKSHTIGFANALRWALCGDDG